METGFNESNRDDHPLVLIIDSDPAVVRDVGQILHDAGHRTAWAEDGRTGISIAEKYRPHVILVEPRLPVLDGIGVCRELKSRLSTADTPVIFISGAVRTDLLVASCFEAGGHDFLTKPVRPVELLARIRVALREEAVREGYRRLATLDPVTGLANRRQLFLHIYEAIAMSRRDSSESFLLLADLDGLTVINQRYGYDFGDEIILTFSRLIRRVVSPTCKAGRIGGDEFAIVVTAISSERVLQLARRLSRSLASIAFDADSQAKHFSAGFGIARYDGIPQPFNADVFVKQSDVALFAAKESGKGRIVAYWNLDPTKLPSVVPEKRHARSRVRRRTERSFLAVSSPEPKI